jgi:hypothetical protein
MKIRTITNSTASCAALDTPWVHVPCNGSASISASNTYGPYSFATNQVEECLQGELGRGKPHYVLHRKQTKVLNHTGVSFKLASGAGGTDGVATFSGGASPLMCLYWKNDTLDRINYWDVQDRYPGQHVPLGWSIGDGNKSNDALIEDCFNKASGLQADVLLNMVEANQMWPSLKSLITAIPEMGYSWGSLRKSIRTASGAFLAWKFGVSPILQDMSNIYKYLPKMVEDLRRHDELANFRYSALTSHPCSFLMAPYVHQTQQGYSVHISSWEGRAGSPPVTRYVLVVRPRVKYMTGIGNLANVVMSRFATGPATLAWETMPFSFVVDWFVDLRGLLRKVDDALRVPPYEVVSFTRSHKYLLETTSSVQRLSPCSGASIYQERGGSYTYHHYERSVVPARYSTPSWNVRFGKNQAGITAALIAQMLSGSKRSARTTQ